MSSNNDLFRDLYEKTIIDWLDPDQIFETAEAYVAHIIEAGEMCRDQLEGCRKFRTFCEEEYQIRLRELDEILEQKIAIVSQILIKF